MNQKVAKLLLEQLGYRDVDAVGNGIEAIAALERQSYDVVLMDVQMPEMDGIDATRWIRGRWKRVPKIIALTAHALSGDRERCIQAGMDGYLAKPIQLPELEAELARVCAVAPARRASARDEEPAAARVVARADPGRRGGVADRGRFRGRGARRRERAARRVREGDAKAARRIAHTLGSTAAMVGRGELARPRARDRAPRGTPRTRRERSRGCAGSARRWKRRSAAVIAERDALLGRASGA